MEKECIWCHEVKPIGEFYAHPKMADGHLNYCKECRKTYERDRARAGLKVEIEARRNAKPARREHLARNTRQWREAHPEAWRAQSAVNSAVRDGRLVKATACEECGATGRLHGHHEDYSQPLTVKWLCPACHGRRNPSFREEV
jgi:hypothetical protein